MFYTPQLDHILGIKLKNIIRKNIDVKAPGIIQRTNVNEPLQTGILAIDSMIPIGCGQRELVIGDRQIGKTAIILDIIINQEYLPNPIEKFSETLDAIIYVSIGQRQSLLFEITRQLQKLDAFKKCVFVAATAADSATMQYLAPFTGCTIGE